MSRRLLSTCKSLLSHENPLGLPRSNAPPEIPRRQRGLPEKRSIRNVRKVIAVSSAKGGVGKSTIAVNLALAFARHGHRSGVLDTDIFGPSIPTLLNLSDQPSLTEDDLLIPLTNYGIKSMSMGYLVPTNSASNSIPWRGLMVTKAIQQLLHSVAWPPLDVLVLDLPPGTGDTQLTITQQVHLAGAVVVSTPQDVALIDTKKGMDLFRKVGVEVLGMVQNMSVYVCPHCGKRDYVFGSDGVKRFSEEEGIELLGDVPLDKRICEDADRGMPTVVAEPESERAKALLDISERIGTRIGL